MYIHIYCQNDPTTIVRMGYLQLVAVVVEVAVVEVVVAYPHMLARNNVFLLTYCLVDLCSLKAHLRSR